jgi:hypothetical protein
MTEKEYSADELRDHDPATRPTPTTRASAAGPT